MSRNLLLETGAISEVLGDSIAIWTHDNFVRKQILNHLAKLAKWLSRVVNSYLYGAFDCMLQSESTIYSYLNVKDTLLETGAIIHK